MEIVIQHVMTAPPRPSSIAPGLPAIIDELILALLSKDVEQRIQTMEEFLEKLKSVLQDSPIEDRKQDRVLTPLRTVLITLAFLLIGAAVLYSRNLSSIATPQATGTISPTSTSSPTLQATAIIIKTPTPVSSPTPSTIYALPPLPVLSGTALPTGQAQLDRNNVDQITELARWGVPAINHFAFIDNDQILLSSTSAGIYYLDPQSLTPRYFFDTKGMLSTFTTSADEKWVATGDVNGNVAVWDINDGSEIMRFEANSGPIRSLSFSPDGSRLASAASDKNIYVWDLQKKELLFKLTKHALPINKIVFSPDGNFIVSGGDDFQVLIWDVKTGKISNNFSAAKKINDLDISSDGVNLVLALNNATIEIWNLPAAQLIDTIEDAKIVSPFTYVKFLPNDQLFLTGSEDGFVRIWSTTSTGQIWETPIREVPPPPIQTISVSKNGTRFSVMFEDGLVEIWSISKQAMEFSRQLKYYPVTRGLISADDRLLAFQGGNSHVEIWMLQTGVQKSVIEGVLPRGNAFFPDSTKIFIQSADFQLYLLTTTGVQYLFKLDNFPKNGSVNYSQDGKIVLASSAGAINFWSVSTGRELKPNNLKNEQGCKVIFALNGKYLGAGSAIGVLNSDNNMDYFCSVSRGPRTISEDFLSDGSIIALSLENGIVEVWDSRNEGDKRILTSASSGDVLDVAVSNSGALLASASSSGVIEIYDLETLELITTLNLHVGSVNQVFFSNDGKYIISGTTDGTIRIFGLHP
jgi:WD40 repeat protein